MTQAFSDQTYQRTETPEHKESIRSEAAISKSRATQIIDNVFKHFTSAFAMREPHLLFGRDHKKQVPTLTNETDKPSADWLGWTFYHEYYTEVQVTRGTTGKGGEITFDQFFEEITMAQPDDGRNYFHFLLGEIGDGKTAFINWMMTTQFPKKWKDPKGCRFWFVRLNPDYQTFASYGDDLEGRKLYFFHALRQRLRHVFDEIVKNSGYDDKALDRSALGDVKSALLRADETKPLSELKTALTKVVHAISTLLGRKLLLIIDNLDSFFHEHDRYLFMSSEGTGEDKSINMICDILIEFFHVTSPIGRLGVDLLVVLRPDSYELLKAKRRLFAGFEACFEQDRNAYCVSKPSWSEVIRQRLYMLKHIRDRLSVNAENEEICAHLANLLEDLDVRAEDTKYRPPGFSRHDEEIYDTLRALSNQGIRSIVHFFSMYAWLPEQSEVRKNLTQRYIDQQQVGVIAFVLDNKRRFSQYHSRFPNLFMVNGPAFSDSAEVKKRSNGRFDIRHRHTYWLKVAILNCLASLTPHEAINGEDIINIFCGGLEDDRSEEGYFAPGIVRLVLGSFAQAHQTSLITVGRKLSPDYTRLLTDTIKLTERGKYLIERLAFSFPYLQLVVDDHFLRLPRRCMPFFSYPQDISYSYIVSLKSDYIRKSNEMLLHKIPWVAKFLAILAESQIIERDEVYHPVFSKLKALGVSDIEIDDKISSYLDEVKAISTTRTKRLFFDRYSDELSRDRVEKMIADYRSEMKGVIKCIY